MVIEIGSRFVRVGFAGEMKPRFQEDTSIILPSHSSLSPLSVHLFEVFSSVFLDKLNVKPKECRVLIVENMFSSRMFRECLFKTLTLQLLVHSVCFQPDLLMPIIATGCRSGCIIDIEYNEVRSIAIYEGRPIFSSVRTSPVGVCHAVNRFKLQLAASADASSISTCAALVEELFEKFAICSDAESISFDNRIINSSSSAGASYIDKCTVVPDKCTVVPGALRSTCLNELINGCQQDGFDTSEDEIGGIIGIVKATLLACPQDIRREITGNLVFCGGGSSITHIAQYICSKLTENIDFVENEIYMQAIPFRPIPFHRNLLTWIGSSIFAYLKSNEEKYLTYRDQETSNVASNKISAKDSYNILEMESNERGISQPCRIMPDWMSLNPDDWKFLGPRLSRIGA